MDIKREMMGIYNQNKNLNTKINNMYLTKLELVFLIMHGRDIILAYLLMVKQVQEKAIP